MYAHAGQEAKRASGCCDALACSLYDIAWQAAAASAAFTMAAEAASNTMATAKMSVAAATAAAAMEKQSRVWVGQLMACGLHVEAARAATRCVAVLLNQVRFTSRRWW